MEVVRTIQVEQEEAVYLGWVSEQAKFLQVNDMLRLIHLRALLNTLYNPCNANHEGFRVAELPVPVDRALYPVLVNDMRAALSYSPQQLKTNRKSG